MFKPLCLALPLLMAMLPVRASQLPDYPFIHVTGDAWQNAMPDRGAVDFDIVAFDGNPELARGVVEARVGQVRALVDALGAGVAQLETRDVRKEIHKGEPVREGVNVDVKCTVHINVQDLSKWRELMQALLDMPNIDGMSTEFEVGEREKVEMELSVNALKDAMRRGEQLAAGFGKKLGAVAGVTTGQLKNLSKAMGLVASDFPYRQTGKRDKETKDFLMIDVIKLRQSVDVVFRIK